MNRRSFIQGLGLITGSAFIALQSDAFAKLKHGETIKGKVTASGKGIKDVVISDGYSVALTDTNGNYSIAPHQKAESLFMSTPAGYEFKTDYNVVRQYEVLGSKNQYDFKLKALNKKDDKHNFIIWADPQVKNKKDVKQMMDTSVPDTLDVIKSLGKDALVHGICVGDIVWDNHALYPDYNEAVAEMGIPFFQALGNHDMDYRMGGDETSDKTFKLNYGPTYYSFNRGKAHYVVLDNVRYLGTERNYDGYISEEQLAWLAKDLQYIAKDQLLIINLHIPVYNQVKNNKDFYAVLEGFKNVHIMSGHTHYNANNITNGIFEHNHGTVCGAWWTGPICEDGTPRGYAVYEVNGNKLKWYYKSTGFPKEHQIKLYADRLTNQTRVIANVWNWDPEWKVEYFLDGKPMGKMENQVGLDPLSVTLYQGPELPAGRHFPEPRQTDHLFIAHFDAAVKTIKVTATDRFGEKYTTEINA
ncbi:calcineurin-like phosphoesterase family protein [Pedobacter sp. MC2016-14]|uniref:calcineurin-like phosphoesterase C-terminal domain-containing protein n=1 Tax=Pedobacter sp. MC2016-14 TaxID=2897327 RepID=UPI001E5FE6DD|nr:calcineurin-like phosphoesterase family protein [Pedobacter sp. MC2016-14]MCD0488161.1 calcineurin-like phosphoesterase family protein [Pedobacter sp. MC2016-14]